MNYVTFSAGAHTVPDMREAMNRMFSDISLKSEDKGCGTTLVNIV